MFRLVYVSSLHGMRAEWFEENSDLVTTMRGNAAKSLFFPWPLAHGGAKSGALWALWHQ
jgi:hypothetical protein